MTTYQSLLATAGRIPPLDTKESDEDYLKRLVLAVSSVTIPTFQAMPEDARLWFESAADALSAGMRMPLPDGYDRDAALPQQMVVTHETRGVGYPQRIARPLGAAYVKPPAAPAAPAAPADPLQPRPGETVRETIIKLMLANPELTLTELMAKLAEHHVRSPVESVGPTRSMAVMVMRLAREAGWRQPGVPA